MKIINLITSVNGIVESVESYIIDEWLEKVDSRFFTEKEVLQLYYFGMNEENALCLHSEDERNTQKSVKLFKQENPDFCKYLEFFTEDNPIRFNQIMNKYYERK